MDLLVIGDNHGDIENMISFLERLEAFKFDVIIYTGDFTDLNAPKGFTQKDITEILIEELKTLNKPILAVPGNNDTNGVLDVMEKEGISIHGKGRVMGEYGFYGFGGAKTPFATPFEPTEEELRQGLEKAYSQVVSAKHKIQITHNPPYGTYVDVIRAGVNVGSQVVRKFIEEKKPVLAVSAHIHEAKGIGKLSDTVLLNAGKFPEGYFGLVNIVGSNVKARVLNLIE
ncbi:MAG: metallophosphoesterase [Candidatus Aenigmarchaeota archaeon]|nr:metallophosphoesterase [Candidatus Aenigmarchaeota archaeon]